MAELEEHDVRAVRAANIRRGRAAGARFEDKCKKFLESLGWTADKARQAVKFIGPGRAVGTANDFFGCVDVMAVNPDKNYTLFVQCTKDSGVGRKKRDLEAVRWNLDSQRVQVWLPLQGMRGGIRVLRLMSHGTNEREAVWVETLFRMATGVEPEGGVL